MHIPFVIDNQQHTMSAIIHQLLAERKGQSLDVATAYFNVGGWQLLQAQLERVSSFRLLLGDEPASGADIGMQQVEAKLVKGLISELSHASFDAKTLRLVEDLTAFLQQPHVQVRLYGSGFLHAKCYLLYGDSGLAQLNPLVAIVGSSNFTRPGLLTNKELNLVHRANLRNEEIGAEQVIGLMSNKERQQLKTLDGELQRIAANVPGLLAMNELAEWYERQWAVARDFKEELLDLLDASKFGRKEYTPYQVYMKAVYEYFRDDLAPQEESAQVRSAI
jgi:phosphatidylserine/phosphatidylglycerophosphate/cardiolipin synthase-like enzyme